jgi:hypothetical protein
MVLVLKAWLVDTYVLREGEFEKIRLFFCGSYWIQRLLVGVCLFTIALHEYDEPIEYPWA